MVRLGQKKTLRAGGGITLTGHNKRNNAIKEKVKEMIFTRYGEDGYRIREASVRSVHTTSISSSPFANEVGNGDSSSWGYDLNPFGIRIS